MLHNVFFFLFFCYPVFGINISKNQAFRIASIASKLPAEGE